MALLCEIFFFSPLSFFFSLPSLSLCIFFFKKKEPFLKTIVLYYLSEVFFSFFFLNIGTG